MKILIITKDLVTHRDVAMDLPDLDYISYYYPVGGFVTRYGIIFPLYSLVNFFMKSEFE